MIKGLLKTSGHFFILPFEYVYCVVHFIGNLFFGAPIVNKIMQMQNVYKFKAGSGLKAGINLRFRKVKPMPKCLKLAFSQLASRWRLDANIILIVLKSMRK